jgi:phage major head subunit gpT-like protein
MPVPGGVTTRANLGALMERGVRKVVFDQWDRFPNSFEQIYNMERADKKTITDAVVTGFGVMPQKTEGAQIIYDTLQQAWTRAYNARTYAMGFEVTKEAMQDDLYGYVVQAGKEMGRTAKYTKNVEAWSVFNNLSDTLYTADGTNFTLLSTAQYRKDGGTWSNRPTNPVDLTIESLEAALTQFRTGMLDQRGRKWDIQPKWLVVGPTDEFVAARLLKSIDRPFSNNNDINTIRTERNLQLLVADYMTDDSRWFLLGDKSDTGLNYFDRMDLTVERGDDQRTGNMLLSAWWRADWGATHVTGIWGSPP